MAQSHALNFYFVPSLQGGPNPGLSNEKFTAVGGPLRPNQRAIHGWRSLEKIDALKRQIGNCSAIGEVQQGMDKTNFHNRPVRYSEVAGKISRDAFYANFTRIISNIYLHNDIAQDPLKITEAFLKRCPDGVFRGFSALTNIGWNIGWNIGQEDWHAVISIPSEASRVRVKTGLILRRVKSNVVEVNGPPIGLSLPGRSQRFNHA